jgi:citrate lyase alpha subunit
MARVKLTEEQVSNIENAVEEYGEIQAYSGRAMYGSMCLGIVTSNVTECLLLLARNLMDMEERDLLSVLINATSRMDNMGRDLIVYFPSIGVPDEMWEDEDEDETDEDSEAV